ncbi:MAG: hypothetical protein NTY98_05310 [Verrucomicrobia bacterium]|nr:hypothetical protein [Verrucomicrobiota bacterium]
MRVLWFTILGALLLGLGFSGHTRWEAETMAIKRATVFLGSGFHQCEVSVFANGKLVFSGRVASNDAIQYAATIPLHVQASPFLLRIELRDLAPVGPTHDTVSLERKIDCADGPYVTVSFMPDEKLVFWQEVNMPEFY